jgi:hypothetical protein
LTMKKPCVHFGLLVAWKFKIRPYIVGPAAVDS